MGERLRVVTTDGKYTIIMEEAGNLRFLRNGEPWPAADADHAHSGLILTLAQDLDEARASPAEVSSKRALEMFRGKAGLDKKVQQFKELALPGQPQSMHMGTSYLVDDLWHELQGLRASAAGMLLELKRLQAGIGHGPFADVGDFHQKFGLPYYGDGDPPGMLEDDVLGFRNDFMHEELTEFIDACTVGDLAKAADALCDLVYVALGTAHMMHLPFDRCWAEVQRANMTKVRASGADDPASTRKHRMDVVKPPGFVAPNHEPVLEEARTRRFGLGEG